MNNATLYKAALPVLMALSLPAAAFGASGDAGAQTASAEAVAEGAAFGEYEIKAGFIYRFLSFVSWPDEVNADSTVTIGILGKSPFGNAFRSIDGRSIGSRMVKVRFFGGDASTDDLKACHLVYISSSFESRLQEVLKVLDNSPVLTIGDRRGFIDDGGMIGFVSRDKDRVGVEINVAAATRARLTIRSMLKRIAVRIIDDP